MKEFDPYHRWLGIPPEEQPPNHYRLLGITLFESDGEVIRNAADQRMAYLKTSATGQHSELSQRLLNEVSAARVSLLNESKKHAYDDELRRQTAPSRAVPPPPVPAGPQPHSDSAPSRVVVDPGPPARLRNRRHPFTGRKWASPAILTLSLFVLLGAVLLLFLFRDPGTPPESPPPPPGPPPPAVAPFDEIEARKHQEQWADYRGLDVDITNSIGMELRLIPPGEFLMGSPESDPGLYVGKRRQPPVLISEPFYLGVTEVTQEQYERVMGQNPSLIRYDGQRPVEQVTWKDAVEFCRKLSELPEENALGCAYRLPTEAEWEYACRAGSSTKWCCGDDVLALNEYGWYLDNAEEATHRVAQKKANAWGIHDMHGNVWEWCNDLYDVSDNRVYRGGGYNFAAECSQSASRRGSPPEYPLRFVGFRVARGIASHSHDETGVPSQREQLPENTGPLARERAVDLLQVLIQSDDLPKGPWRFDGPTLLSPDGHIAELDIPYTPPEEYDLILTAERRTGQEALFLGLTMDGRKFFATFDAHMSTISGLENLDGREVRYNEAAKTCKVFPCGKAITLCCKIRNGHVSISADDVIIDWTGSPERLSVWSGIDYDGILVRAHKSEFAISRLELIPHDAAKTPSD